MRTFTVLASLFVGLFTAVTSFSHERREIAGMQVVFGGEPEPVLDGEICFLRWRFSDSKTEEPVGTLESLSATIRFDGKEFGPFEARGSRRDPGTYQTQHIFRKPGEGEVTLSFKKAASDEGLTLSLPFTVHSRKSIEIP
jgi:hypothetical protein